MPRKHGQLKKNSTHKKVFHFCNSMSETWLAIFAENDSIAAALAHIM